MNFFKKSFGKWFDLKPKVHKFEHKPPFINEREVWWYHCGENIGIEICGKGKNFLRPCLIYKKLSRYNLLIIPLSTKIKTGTWYIPIYSKNKQAVACLHQITIIDYRRLDEKYYELSETHFQQVKNGFKKLYY